MATVTIPPRAGGAKAARTRAAVLRAATRVFAEKGYAGARLEDIASEVGIRRASLLYYVRDKRELYDAVLADAYADLAARYRTVLAAPATAGERIEAVVTAWVAFIAERPPVARLLLWEAADGSHERTALAAEQGGAIVAALVDVIADGQRQGAFQPIDPLHFVITLMGATVFFVTTTPRLDPTWTFDPLSPEQLAAHRRQLLDIARRLLGRASPEPSAPATSPAPVVRDAGAGIGRRLRERTYDGC